MFIGMEVDQVRQHAQRITDAEATLRERFELLQTDVRSSEAFWRGPDADSFRADWEALGSTSYEPTLTRLTETATRAQDDAEEQDAASGNDAGGSGEGAADPSLTIQDGQPGDPGYEVEIDPEVEAAWADLEEHERKAIIDELIRREFEEYGLEPPEVVYFDDPGDEDGILLGSWNEGDQVMRLNENEAVLASPNILNTVVHEARHAAQYEMIDRVNQDWGNIPLVSDARENFEYWQIEREHGITREEIEAWEENYYGDPGYKSSEEYGFEEYEDQPVERDAREAGEEYVEDLTPEDLEDLQNGEDDGFGLGPFPWT
ncbi:MAG TPA: hypothetical protein H9837_12125 [Candidatus Brachybacterium merdigallinarum]|nr:hypothetical protein [Candidatus Brachybacterium merdigallinarum]